MVRHLSALFFSLLFLVSPVWSSDLIINRKGEVQPIDKIEPVYTPKSLGLNVKISAPVASVNKAEKSIYYAPMEREFPELDFEISNEVPRKDIIETNLSADSIGFSTDSIRYHVNKAKALFDKVTQSNAFVKLVNPQTLMEFPVAIKKEISGNEYMIVIEEVVLTPVDAYFSAYMRLPIPGSETVLTFMAREVHFTKDGGLTGEARLELLEDADIMLSEKSLLRFKGQKTFVQMDCNGFKNLGVSAEVEFSRDMLLPENPDGSLAQEGRVTGAFETVVNSLQDLIIEVNLSPFQLAKRPGFSFAISRAVLDMSDTHNHPAVTFPADYESPYFLEGNQSLWRGFYLQEATVKLPPEFNKSNNPSQRITITGRNLIIDDLGFTGSVAATNLILMDEGNMDGWKYSLDSIGVSFKYGSLETAGFNGEVIVPVGKEQDPQRFAYQGLFLEQGYQMRVETLDKMEFNLWKADAELRPESYIEVNVVDGEFKPKAVLHGSMDVNGPNNLQLAGVEFEHLQIQTVAPYVQAEYFSFGSEAAQQKFANFPLQISDVGLVNDGELTGIRFRAILNFVPSDDAGFGGETVLTVWGKVDESQDGLQKYAYESIEVSEIVVDVEKEGAFKLYGKVVFFKHDPVYGKGFKGVLDANFGGVDVQAMALFGSIDNNRYWYADGLVSSSAGIAISPGLSIYGFGGGAFYHMSRSSNGSGSELGETLSGVTYVPDASSGLGIKASVVLGASGKKESFNGDVTFEIAFTTHGGLSKVAFEGNAYFATSELNVDSDSIKEAAKAQAGGQETPEIKKEAQLRGTVSLVYDHQNKIFHGDLSVYVSIAGGVIRGVGANDLAGRAIIHFAEEEWYVHIGTPTNRIGIKAAGLFETKSYLMIGDNIPEIPDPSKKITDALKKEGLWNDRPNNRDSQALTSGSGFAFGASLSFNTGEKTFLIFYGSFYAEAGFDIMLKNYGESARCAGSLDPLGIDGWYAKGQAYAYFEGSVGIKVNLRFIKGKYDIFTGNAGAYLRAEGPNPYYFMGAIFGNYNILGGLVKGSFSYEVTVGEQCEIVGASQVPDITVIADMSPAENSADVSVFNSPQAVFNMPVGEEFEYKDNEGIKRKFRVKLFDFNLSDEGNRIEGDLDWNSDMKVVALNPVDVLPPETTLLLQVAVIFEEYKNGNWEPIKQDGKIFQEIRSVEFVTGIAPDFIPHENITYSYPLIGQLNYYKGITSSGYIQLEQGQDYLFENSQEWVKKVALVDESGSSLVSEAEVSYDNGANRVSYSLPEGMQNNMIYTIKIIDFPIQDNAPIDQNVYASTEALQSDSGEDMGVEITTQQVEGTLEALSENEVYSANFRSSQYATLESKLNALSIDDGFRYRIKTGIYQLYSGVTGDELFDEFELEGKGNVQPMIRMEAILDDAYFTDEINPVLYNGYPVEGISLSRRNTAELGVPPSKAMYPVYSYETRSLSEEIQTGSAAWDGNQRMSFRYNLQNIYNEDFHDLKYQIAVRFANSTVSNNRLLQILNFNLPVIPNGIYRYKVKYYLPGQNQPVNVVERQYDTTID